MKICKKCKIEKQKTEFYKSKITKDGLRGSCKACAALYLEANRDAIATTRAAYRAANREAISARDAEYKKANRETIAVWMAGYQKSNREKIAARKAEHYAANTEKFIAYSRNRRARVRSAEGSHNSADVRAIFEKQQGLCANCETKLFKSGKQKFHVDHIMPLALGGSNWPANLQCLCPACNLSKCAKHPDDWAKEQGRLL